MIRKAVHRPCRSLIPGTGCSLFLLTAENGPALINLCHFTQEKVDKYLNISAQIRSLTVKSRRSRLCPAGPAAHSYTLQRTVVCPRTGRSAFTFLRYCLCPYACSAAAVFLRLRLAGSLTLSRCQISSTYSWMVLSEENLPTQAVFMMAIFAHLF